MQMKTLSITGFSDKQLREKEYPLWKAVKKLTWINYTVSFIYTYEVNGNQIMVDFI